MQLPTGPLFALAALEDDDTCVGGLCVLYTTKPGPVKKHANPSPLVKLEMTLLAAAPTRMFVRALQATTCPLSTASDSP